MKVHIKREDAFDSRRLTIVPYPKMLSGQQSIIGLGADDLIRLWRQLKQGSYTLQQAKLDR